MFFLSTALPNHHQRAHGRLSRVRRGHCVS
jgi:hypothetical protein